MREILLEMYEKLWNADKAKSACEVSGNNTEDHFADIGKMVSLGSGAQREMKTIEVKTMYKDVKKELPTNTFECVVKMWNQFNDTWVTGIGIYDIPTKQWEVSTNIGEQYPVHFWFAVPNL